jgi:hypothetical protein
MQRQIDPHDDDRYRQSAEIEDEVDEDSELDLIDPDDERWDAFITDDDEWYPQPGHGDFWELE